MILFARAWTMSNIFPSRRQCKNPRQPVATPRKNSSWKLHYKSLLTCRPSPSRLVETCNSCSRTLLRFAWKVLGQCVSGLHCICFYSLLRPTCTQALFYAQTRGFRSRRAGFSFSPRVYQTNLGHKGEGFARVVPDLASSPCVHETRFNAIFIENV